LLRTAPILAAPPSPLSPPPPLLSPPPPHKSGPADDNPYKKGIPTDGTFLMGDVREDWLLGKKPH
jgi:hypothetical protein